jgi:hypothetical protein
MVARDLRPEGGELWEMGKNNRSSVDPLARRYANDLRQNEDVVVWRDNWVPQSVVM